jgi:hypothetical protein
VNKGVSETFDEHEHDTARRAYPQEMVDGSKRTTKMAKLDLNELRTESGTRPVITHDAIERHVREKMEGALVDRSSGVTEDPHSRPTIEAGMLGAIPASHTNEWASTPAQFEPPASFEPMGRISASRPTPLSATMSMPSPERSIAGWVVAVILIGLVFMLSAAGVVGFVLGRRSAHR